MQGTRVFGFLSFPCRQKHCDVSRPVHTDGSSLSHGERRVLLNERGCLQDLSDVARQAAGEQGVRIPLDQLGLAQESHRMARHILRVEGCYHFFSSRLADMDADNEPGVVGWP
jgi:hypothetical protein